jgi:sugar lactone lactonase YvrE
MQLVPRISTVAGDGTAGSTGDGDPATSAELNVPSGVGVDSAGNYYITESSGCRVRKVTVATGDITTVAGNGTCGYSGDNGQATSAELLNPNRVAVDSSGNLYIADYNNNRIRKVTISSGVITTVAGNGTACAASTNTCGDGGAATSAELHQPSGIALDSSGNMYIADSADNRIRKVTISTGYIATVAGTGTAGATGDEGLATSAELNDPNDVQLDSSGNLYIADKGNNKIRKVTVSTGDISTVAGDGTAGFSGDGAAATSAELNEPFSAVVDSSGNIYIGDNLNYRVRKVNIWTGIISTIAGNGTEGATGNGVAATSAELDTPNGMAIDSSGNLYFADSFNNIVRKLQIWPTSFPTTAIGSSSATQDFFLETTAAETITSITAQQSQGGKQEYSVGTITGCYTNGTTSNPSGTACLVPITFSPAYPGARNVPLTAVTGGGTISFALTGEGTGPMGLFTTPTASTLSSIVTEGRGISFDVSGNLYVSGYGSNAVYKITPGGTKSTVTSSITEPAGTVVDGSGNLFVGSPGGTLYEIPAGTTTLNSVATITGGADNALVADSAGNIYVESKTSHNVYQVAAGTYTVTQILTGGQDVKGGTLGRCIGMAIDASNNLYLADYTNNRLYKVTYGTWAVTTLVNDDGNLDEPQGLAIDPAGNLYVSNTNDTVIRYSAGTYTANVFSTSVYTGYGSIAIDASGNLYTSLDSNTSI